MKQKDCQNIKKKKNGKAHKNKTMYKLYAYHLIVAIVKLTKGLTTILCGYIKIKYITYY